MFYKHKITVLLLFVSFLLKGQKPFKEEVCWAIWHPVAALKIKKIHAKASFVYNHSNLKLALDSFSNGGRLDAFRHAFFMAAFAQKIKVKKLRKLGMAHEKGNYHQFLKRKTENGEVADSLSNAMDLSNNELGFKIGSSNKKINLEELKEEVIKEIKKGNALIMQRNRSGLYLDCNNNVLDLKLFIGKWYVPKCLIASN